MYNSVLSVYRGVAQLVARLLWEQDAAGSSPVTPTIRKNAKNIFYIMDIFGILYLISIGR